MTRDLRKFAEQTNRRLIIGFFLILFLIGDGLIFLFFGREAALMGLVCIGFALIPALLIWLLLTAFEWIVKKNRE